MSQFIRRAALAVFAASLLSTNVMAGEEQVSQPAGDILVGQGVVCDTVQQVERFTALMGEEGSAERAVNIVNKEVSNPRACGMVLAAFTRGGEVGEVRNANRAMKVIEITIVAVPVGNQWHFVTPLKQYAAVAAKGIEI